MDDAYKEKLILLQKIVHDGIGKLLHEAKKREYLDPPYGRAAFPTPLITEDEFIGNGALQADDTEPEFKFEYGFDPLKFLAEFIIWSHPNSVEDRRQKKIDASLYLQRRAQHARKQVYISQTLALIAHEQSSGILWGPLTSPIDCRTVICSCKTLKYGKVIYQLSKFRDFREIAEKQEILVDTATDSDEIPTLNDTFPVKATFKGLKPATKYFIRCCLSSNPHIKVLPPRKAGDSHLDPPMEEDEDVEGLVFKGVQGGFFKSSEFWTLPSEDRSEAEAIVQEEEPPAAGTPPVQEHRRHHGHHHVHHHHGHQNHKKAAEEPVEATDPTDEFAPVVLKCFGQLPVSAYTGLVGPITPAPPLQAPVVAVEKRSDSHCPSVTCLLGDIITKADIQMPEDDSEAQQHARRYELLHNIGKLLARCPLTAAPQSPLRANSFVLGWRDSSAGSNYALRAEELAFKQYRQEVKRHKKKFAKAKSSNGGSTTAAVHIPPPPAISRLPLTDSVRSILQGLPINPDLFFDPIPQLPPPPAAGTKNKPNAAAQAAAAAAAAQVALDNLKACRMMYRTVMLGPDVVLIVLDMRGQGIAGDYLGSEQAAWLDIVLQESVTIQWKIILCGKSFGLINVQGGDTAVNAEEEIGSQVRAAAIEDDEFMPEDLPPISELAEGVAEMSILEGISEDKELEMAPEAAVSVSAKQVQLPHAHDKNHAAITAAIAEGIEDGYGRSVCSLQHVLAVHQSRLNQGLYSIPTSAGTKVVHLTSGIVLLTSGQASVSEHLVATPAMHHHHSEQRDVSAPAFVTGYMNLSAPSANSPSDVEGQLMPTKSDVTRRIPSQLFCAEVSLGWTKSPVLASATVKRLKSAATAPEFFYRDGFDARTIYSALDDDCTVSNDTAGDSAVVMSDDSCGLGSVPYCNLVLQSNGQLQLRLFSAESAAKGIAGAVPIFDCVLEAPIAEDENEDEAED